MPKATIVGNAAAGDQAVDVGMEDKLDLVFTDYMMPVMDGAGLLRALAADPVLRAIPVVVMSSMPEAAVAERCSGYVAFMRKPFKIAHVIEVAAGLVNHLQS